MSQAFSTVAASGMPSKNSSVPMRVSTLSGVVISGGIAVVIFIFGGAVSLTFSVGCGAQAAKQMLNAVNRIAPLDTFFAL